MRSYIAIIHKDAKSDFGVSFPDFPGCVTVGLTLNEARENAIEALEFHLAGMVEDGEPLPKPSTLEAVMRDPVAQSGVAVLVDLPADLDKSVRVNITVSERDLAKIDAAAEELGMSRSAFLVRSAIEPARKKRRSPSAIGTGANRKLRSASNTRRKRDIR